MAPAKNKGKGPIRTPNPAKNQAPDTLSDHKPVQTAAPAPKNTKRNPVPKKNTATADSDAPPEGKPKPSAKAVSGKRKALPAEDHAPEPNEPLPNPSPAKKVRKTAPRPQPKGKNAEIVPDESPTVSPGPGTQAISTGNTEQRPIRAKNASEIARKAAAQEQEAAASKAAKAKRKKAKADATPIDETPEETRAFLAAMRHESQSTEHRKTLASNASAAPLKPLRQEQRAQVLQRIKSSLAEKTAESSSKPTTPLASPQINPPSSTIVQSTTPSTQPSRAQTPTTSPYFPNDNFLGGTPDLDEELPFDEGGVEQEELLDAVKGLPKHLAPIVELPEPLKGIAHPPQRSVPLPDIDVAELKLSARQRKALKASRRLNVRGLVETDRLVVSAAMDRAKAILVTHNPFPARPVASMIAAQANIWACIKFGANLSMEVDSEYEDLILQRFGTFRSAMQVYAIKEVPLRFGLKSTAGDNQEAMEKNMETVEMWLQGLNFTCPDKDHLADFYENPIFYDIIQTTYFGSAKACGPLHRDLWSTALTIPCLAYAATVVEKVLIDYSVTGAHKKSDFAAEVYGPKWMSHVVTLREMYKADPERLEKYCENLLSRLMSPFGVQKAGNKPIGPRISVSRISALYGKRKGASSTDASSAVAGVSKGTPSHTRKASGPSSLRQGTPTGPYSPQATAFRSPLAETSLVSVALQSPITLANSNTAVHSKNFKTSRVVIDKSQPVERTAATHANKMEVEDEDVEDVGDVEEGEEGEEEQPEGDGEEGDGEEGEGEEGEGEEVEGEEGDGEGGEGSEREEGNAGMSDNESDGDGTGGAGPATRNTKQVAQEMSDDQDDVVDVASGEEYEDS